MLGWVRNTVKKSKAAVIVQNLFEGLPTPWVIPFPRAKFANMLVEATWSDHPQLFDTSVSASLHPVAIAALTLGNGLEAFADNSVIRPALKGSLGRLLTDVESSPWRYSFNGLDLALLDEATAQYVHCPWDGRPTDSGGDEATVIAETMSSAIGIQSLSDAKLSARTADLDATMQAFRK